MASDLRLHPTQDHFTLQSNSIRNPNCLNYLFISGKIFLLSSCIANFNEHMIVIFYRSLYKDSICWYHQFIIISTCITYNMSYLAPFDPCLTRLKFKSTAGPNVTVTSCVCGWKLFNRKKKLQYFQTNSMEDLKAKIYCKNY